MESYNAFASYYDELMEDARYEERCRYILEAARRFDHPMGRTLDLACGTGSLTLLLRQSGVDVHRQPDAFAAPKRRGRVRRRRKRGHAQPCHAKMHGGRRDGALCAAGDAGADIA